MVAQLNEHRPFDDDYQEFVVLVRQLIAASMTAALRRAAEMGELRLIADTLQHAMLELASDLPTVAARYRPAAANMSVGGDWYEVVDLGAGRRSLIVGDCVGSGLEAATAMGALRNVSRAVLSDGQGPAEVLSSLHRFAKTTPAALCATVVCAVVDLHARTVTYSNAGHPPPLLVREGTAIWLDEALGTPLAVGDPDRTEAEVTVHVGDVLILYTDGLIERRGEAIDVGLQRLAASAVAHREESVQSLADHLIADLVPEAASDDVALVVKRVHRPPAPRLSRRRRPCSSSPQIVGVVADRGRSDNRSMTTTEQNKTIVVDFIESLFTKGDLAAVDEYLAEDFVNNDPPFGASADREGMRSAGAMFRSVFPDWHSDLDQLVAEGDIVVERFTASGTHTGTEIMGVAAIRSDRDVGGRQHLSAPRRAHRGAVGPAGRSRPPASARRGRANRELRRRDLVPSTDEDRGGAPGPTVKP